LLYKKYPLLGLARNKTKPKIETKQKRQKPSRYLYFFQGPLCLYILCTSRTRGAVGGGGWGGRDGSNYLLWRLRKSSAISFYRGLELHLLRAKNAIKKSSKNTEGWGNKRRSKKPQLFCDEPRWICLFENIFSRF
jgi:hypothetical protein